MFFERCPKLFSGYDKQGVKKCYTENTENNKKKNLKKTIKAQTLYEKLEF